MKEKEGPNYKVMEGLSYRQRFVIMYSGTNLVNNSKVSSKRSFRSAL